MMKTYTVAKAASKGIVMGKAFVAVQEDLTADSRSIKDSEREMEWLKFQKAVKDAVEDLRVLAKDSDIFAAHLDVAEDTVLHDSVELKINSENKNAQLALEETVAEIVTMFESLDDEYLRERAADIKDVGKRIMCGLKGIKSNPFEGINEDVIVVAEDLAPSDTANMDFRYIKGFITEAGGVTSHVSIMARSMEIPAFVGVADFRKNVTNEDYIILDAVGKEIIVNPDEETKEVYRKKAAEYKAMKAEFESMNNLPATTTDGRTVELFANVGSIVDVENAVTRGAEGIGLFRSEFLYLGKTALPDETEQFNTYRQVLQTMGGKKVIIRTLDIGADKNVDYLGLGKEDNPAMGYRAIRICLKQPDVFKTQLRALLRAAKYGNLAIMYPMIISVDEVLRIREIVAEVAAELKREQIPYAIPEQGIMIETPAAVMICEELAELVDFFSIGTNDLTQTTFGFSRDDAEAKFIPLYMHKKILKDNPFETIDSAVLELVRMAVEKGRATNPDMHFGVCGEHGGDPKSIKGLFNVADVDYVSCSPYRVPLARLAAAQAKLEAKRSA